MNAIELHRETWDQLGRRRAQLPHALLIAGQRGIGKSELARRFAESLLCENPGQDNVACGACLACGWLAQGNHPDFRLVQPGALSEDDSAATESASKKKPSQQITIEQVRSLDDFLHVGTHRQGVRVILINPAEAMNRATANALLKSLEEPVEGTVFILVTSEPERLLPTIRSRCQVVVAALPPHDRAMAWLQDVGVNDADRWLALAGGAPLLAEELGGDGERGLVDALIKELARGPGIEPLTAAAVLDRAVKADTRPAPLKRLVEWVQKWVFDLALVSVELAPRYFQTQHKVLRELAKSSDVGGVLAFSRKAIQYRMECEQPLNSRLFLEDFFLRYAALFETH